MTTAALTARGSQLQVQIYVNRRPGELTRALLRARKRRSFRVNRVAHAAASDVARDLGHGDQLADSFALSR
jgi:hypothetical protein